MHKLFQESSFWYESKINFIRPTRRCRSSTPWYQITFFWSTCHSQSNRYILFIFSKARYEYFLMSYKCSAIISKTRHKPLTPREYLIWHQLACEHYFSYFCSTCSTRALLLKSNKSLINTCISFTKWAVNNCNVYAAAFFFRTIKKCCFKDRVFQLMTGTFKGQKKVNFVLITATTETKLMINCWHV